MKQNHTQPTSDTPPAVSRARAWIRRLRWPLAMVALLLGTTLVWSATVQLPEGALSPGRLASVKITDRHGTLMREVLSVPDGRASWVPLSAIAEHLVQATLAGEDQRFWQHGGVDWLALGRAAWQAISGGRVVSGASTITMQLARMTAKLPPRSATAKARQMVLAWKLERRLNKKQILWHYLNTAPYGNGTFGIEAAARRYLDKPAAQLSLAEAALLSALPRSPARYNPYRHRARLVRRQRYILELMRRQGRITAEQRRLARAEPIDWEAASRPFSAPHLSRDLLGRHDLASATRIRTTVDAKLQQAVEAAVQRAVQRLSQHGGSNAAVLVLDNRTAEVLAHVGSANFFDEDGGGQVDGTLALRQPGSTIKPITYALALEQGKTPASLLRDLPSHFATDRGDYAPRNYDDTFHGPVRLRVALASSYNVPAVRLTRFVGVDRLLRRLHDLGFASLTRPARHYGLGLTLGNGEVTLHELAAAYVALAHGGRYRPLRRVVEARDARGKPLALPRPSARQVIPRELAYLVTQILADPLARVPAFGRDTVLDLGFAAAVKTGTSKDFRDNWTVGYTPQRTVAVWVGNFDGSGMHNVSGITGAGPLWAEVMRLANDSESKDFSRPSGIAERRICALSGQLLGPLCPAGVDELFLSESVPTRRCTAHREVAVDRENGLLAGPGCPAQRVEQRRVVDLPPVFVRWARQQGLPTAPSSYSPACPGAGDATPAVRVVTPQPGDRFTRDPDLRATYQRIPLEAAVHGPAEAVLWLVDGRPLASAPFPYTASWPIAAGRHTIVAALPGGALSEPVTITVE